MRSCIVILPNCLISIELDVSKCLALAADAAKDENNDCNREFFSQVLCSILACNLPRFFFCKKASDISMQQFFNVEKGNVFLKFSGLFEWNYGPLKFDIGIPQTCVAAKFLEVFSSELFVGGIFLMRESPEAGTFPSAWTQLSLQLVEDTRSTLSSIKN